MKSNLITLTTDFGDDLYVAQIKGRILSINPDVKIVDLTHKISKYNIVEGAFFLLQVVDYFPKSTIHIVVVDPGVGGTRKETIIETDNGIFVGPDNGIFSPVLKNRNIKKIIEIDKSKLPGKISQTFHGRDIFAPIAARLSLDEKPETLGNKKQKIKKLILKKNSVAYIDAFGNIITTCDKKFKINDELIIKLKNKKHSAKFVKTFSDVSSGGLLVLEGSSGFLEVDVNRGNAARKLNARVGDKIEILKC